MQMAKQGPITNNDNESLRELEAIKRENEALNLTIQRCELDTKNNTLKLTNLNQGIK
jgi:hypothetical protein